MKSVNLWGLPQDIDHYFNRQPWSNFLHGLYTPPVCLEDAESKKTGVRNVILFLGLGDKAFSGGAGDSYLIVVAFGEEQGTELAVQRRLVGLVAVFG